MTKNLDKKTLEVLLEKGLISKKDIENLVDEKEEEEPHKDLLARQSFTAFVTYLKNQYSSNTVSSYKADIENFLQYLHQVDDLGELRMNDRLKKITVKKIQDYLDSLLGNGYGSSTLRRHKHSIKTYLDYLKKYGYNSPNVDEVNIPEQETSKIDALRDDEIREMSDYASKLRDKVLILFMYETGMRRQELIDCKKEHVDFKNLTVKIYRKREFDRVGYFTKELKNLLSEYLEEWKYQVNEINEKRLVRSKTKGDKYKELKISEYLFQTHRSPKISYSTIFKALKDTAYEYRLNVEVKQGTDEEVAKDKAKEWSDSINTETLRHSRRAYLFAIGKTVEQVQAIMGDENKWVCKRYLKIAQQLYPEKFRV